MSHRQAHPILTLSPPQILTFLQHLSLSHPLTFSPFIYMADIDDIIAGGGIVFRKAKSDNGNDSGKVKTKAKKKQYITGAHGSGSARQKAKYREQRANRHKK